MVVRTDRDEPVATITLNRPDVRNAMNIALLEALTESLREADADDEVGAIILTGADPAFCAGVDLKAAAAGEFDLSGGGPDLPAVFHDLDTPVIGAVNGVTVTGGLELALLCDFLIASDRARFADTHARVGIHPSWGLTATLPQAVGIRYARQMSFTGNYVDADEAARIGLVNQVVPHDELLPTVERLAADIASNDAVAVSAIRRTYLEVSATTLAEGLTLERRRAADLRFDPEEVDRRREAVIARGREQTGSDPGAEPDQG
ncbi:MAG: enoyl-CoA hydratase [Nitriliruptorales bacterium]|nr:enoyl-CoA hydratase [Nitriliruptorales bacterium]